MTLFVTILQLLCGLIVIGIVLFQSGKSAGLSGAIGGVADSFMAKNKAKSTDARLARATKWVGAAFIVLGHAADRRPYHRSPVRYQAVLGL